MPDDAETTFHPALFSDIGESAWLVFWRVLLTEAIRESHQEKKMNDRFLFHYLLCWMILFLVTYLRSAVRSLDRPPSRRADEPTSSHDSPTGAFACESESINDKLKWRESRWRGKRRESSHSKLWDCWGVSSAAPRKKVGDYVKINQESRCLITLFQFPTLPYM